MKRIIGFLLAPFRVWCKAIEERECWFHDEMVKALDDQDWERAFFLSQMRDEVFGLRMPEYLGM